MPTPPAPPPPLDDRALAELLAQAAWVRRLAGSLVRDDSLADDLTQEAWVAALRHPPQQGRPLRPWLAEVLRNLVRMRARGERRRQAREARTQSTESVDSTPDTPEQLVARATTQRELTDLVVALAEPFRSTILLRYYEGLDSAAIAARQGVPAGTVRWRLKTGLDKLRAELDRAHDGKREAWLPAVAPLALSTKDAAGLPTAPARLPQALAPKLALPMLLVIAMGATGAWLVTRTTQPPLPTTQSPPPATREPTAQGRPRIDRAQRTQLLQRIVKAQRHSRERASAATENVTRELDAEYIREQMMALVPLVRECYENALREQPQLAGTLVVSFTIVAEPEIGGLVTDSRIDSAASTIHDAAMRECVQETMYGAQFPAPRNGGELQVSYPFDFKSEGDGGER